MAPQKIVGGTAQLFAFSNGDNYALEVGVINGPLLQEYRKGTNICSPDWENSAEKPIIYAHLFETVKMIFKAPTLLDLKYNGVKIEFDSSGLSTGAMAGVFKKSVRSLNLDGRDYPNMITFEIQKNLVTYSGDDNDRVTLEGAFETSGSRIDFSGLNRSVEIVEMVGQSYRLNLSGQKNITNNNPKAVIKGDVTVDGVTPADMTAYVLKWYDATGDKKTLINTGSLSIEIAASQVDATKTIFCELLKKSTSELLASCYANIDDYTDPYYLYLYVDGVKGESIESNQTAVYTAKVEKSDGTVVAGAVTHFITRDIKGNTIPSMTGTRSTVSATYEEVAAAGGGIFLYASATVDVV